MKTQPWLGGTLAVAVILFEIDIRMAGCTFALVAPSPYTGMWWLTAILYIQLIIAVLTSVILVSLIYLPLRRFNRPPAQGAFSAIHRLWGRVGMVMMTPTGLTAYPLYFSGSRSDGLLRWQKMERQQVTDL